MSNTPSAWGFSLEELREAQGKDQNLELILEWMKSSVKPEESALFIASPATKSYWLNKEQCVLIDGVLFRNRNDSDEKDLVVPESLSDGARGESRYPISGSSGCGENESKDEREVLLVWYVYRYQKVRRIMCCL